MREIVCHMKKDKKTIQKSSPKKRRHSQKEEESVDVVGSSPLDPAEQVKRSDLPFSKSVSIALFAINHKYDNTMFLNPHSKECADKGYFRKDSQFNNSSKQMQHQEHNNNSNIHMDTSEVECSPSKRTRASQWRKILSKICAFS